MRKGYSKSSTFVDTGLLRDHVSKLREEKKTALELQQSILTLRNNSGLFDEFYPILRDVNQLVEYLDRMSNVLNEAEAEAIQLIHEVSKTIEMNTDQARYISSHTFML